MMIQDCCTDVHGICLYIPDSSISDIVSSGYMLNVLKLKHE